MFAIRLYLATLTLIFLASMMLTNRLGILAFIIGASSLTYLIIDTREELRQFRSLETQVLALLQQLNP